MAASRRVGTLDRDTVAAVLDARVQHQLSLIFWGLLFARGRPRKYGAPRIDLAKRAGQPIVHLAKSRAVT
jgi:hypothetical protein